MTTADSADSARERILSAAEQLFAESGFDATPTSRIAERAGVPKGLVHYYFRRKPELLAALVARLPDARIEPVEVVVPGDIAGSLRKLIDELDHQLTASRMLSHLLWREADTHDDVRDALHERFRSLLRQFRVVIEAAAGRDLARPDVESASGLLARSVSYRHSVARHAGEDPPGELERELAFVAAALTPPSRP
jgi:AcrR family transcriptional regulator